VAFTKYLLLKIDEEDLPPLAQATLALYIIRRCFSTESLGY